MVLKNNIGNIISYLKSHTWIPICFFFFIYVVYALIGQIREDNFIRKNGRYVIGEILNAKGSRGGYIADYKFTFAGQVFIHRGDINYNNSYVGFKCLVLVLPFDPNKSKLLDSIGIPPNVKLIQPDSGWKYNPLHN